MQTEGSARYLAHDSRLIGNGTVVETSTGTLEDFLLSIHAKIKDFARFQEDTARAREDFHVERSRIRSAAAAVRSQRTITGDAEIQLMNHLRNFYHEHSEVLPPSIEAAYEKVVQERDQLGTLEDDYVQDERAFGGLEWSTSQKERALYQYDLEELLAKVSAAISHHNVKKDYRPPLPPEPVLLGDGIKLVHNAPPPPPPPPVRLAFTDLHIPKTISPHIWPMDPHVDMYKIEERYRSEVVELDRLRKEFNLLRPQQSEMLARESKGSRRRPKAHPGPLDSEFFNTYSNLLTKLSECEVRVLHLRQEKMQFRTDLSRRMSAPAHVNKQDLSPFNAVTRAQTDGVLPKLIDNPNVQPRLREWLMECFRNNAIERKTYLNILAKEGISVSDTNSLDEYLGQYWPVEPSNRSSSAHENNSVETFDDSSDHPYPLRYTHSNAPDSIIAKSKRTVESVSPSPSFLQQHSCSGLDNELSK